MEMYAERFGIEHDSVLDASTKKSHDERVEIDGVFFEAKVYGDHAIIVNYGDLIGHKSKELFFPESIGGVPVTVIAASDDGDISYEDLGRCSASVAVLPPSVREIAGDGLYPSKNNGGIQEFKLAGDSEYFTVKDGVLYSKDETTLILYPDRSPEPSKSLRQSSG